MQLTITKVTVVVRDYHTDTILCESTLPNTTWPCEGSLSIKFECPKGTGADYVRKYFKMEPEVIRG